MPYSLCFFLFCSFVPGCRRPILQDWRIQRAGGGVRGTRGCREGLVQADTFEGVGETGSTVGELLTESIVETFDGLGEG